MFFLPFSKFNVLSLDVINSLNFPLAYSNFLFMFLLGPFSFRLFFEFIKFFLFVISINLVEIVSLFDFVLSEEEEDDSVILFDFGFDSESMAIEAVHFEEFKQSIDDERIVSRQDEFNVARVA